MIIGTMNKQKKRLGWLLFFFLLPAGQQLYAAVAADFERIMHEIAASRKKTAFFVEKKVAFYLDEPLISKGKLYYEYPDKLEKTLVSPVSEKQIIHGDEIKILKQDGSEEHVYTSDHPGIQSVVSAFLALLSGDADRLRAMYAVSSFKQNGGWRLELEPADENIKKWIKHIEVKGKKGKILSIKVIEFNDDYTLTTLYDHEE